jgi:putative peptide zinc metalloprotease protein
MRTALYSPLLLLAMLGAIVVATAYHEIGHASACRYGGARPGVLGAGVYLVWPAFYCDVTDAYRLGRAGRLRTDLGGVYFNLLFALLAGALFAVTGWELLVLVILAQHTIVLQQLMPLLRFDGYYVVSDLTGVPDILTRIKPIFASLVPGREADPRVAELKNWVRVAVTTYVIVLVPALLFLFVTTVMGAPRMFATAYDSLGLQLDRIREADGAAAGAVGVLSLLALALPCLAVALSLGRAGKRVGGGVGKWASASVPRAALASAVTVALVGFAAYTWWPNGDYEPLRPGERGTVGEALGAVRSIPSGRPAFSPAREAEFGAVPTERERREPEATPTPEATATPEAAETPDATPEPTATPTAEATATVEATPEATATAEPTVTAEPTPTPTG